MSTPVAGLITPALTAAFLRSANRARRFRIFTGLTSGPPRQAAL